MYFSVSDSICRFCVAAKNMQMDNSKTKLLVNNYDLAAKLFSIKLQDALDDWSSKYHQAWLVEYFLAFSKVFTSDVGVNTQKKTFKSLLNYAVFDLIGRLGTSGSFQKLYNAQCLFIYRLFDCELLDEKLIPVQFQHFVNSCFSNVLKDLSISSRFGTSFALLKVMFQMLERYPNVLDSCYHLNGDSEIQCLTTTPELFPFFTASFQISVINHDFELLKALLRFLLHSPVIERAFDLSNIFYESFVPLFQSETRNHGDAMISRMLPLIQIPSTLFRKQFLDAIFITLESTKLSHIRHYIILKHLILFEVNYKPYEKRLVKFLDYHIDEWPIWNTELCLSVLKSMKGSLIYSQFCTANHQSLDSSKTLTRAIKDCFLSFFFNRPSLNLRLLEGIEILKELHLTNDDDFKIIWNIHIKQANFLSRLINHPDSKGTSHLITFPEPESLELLSFKTCIADSSLLVNRSIIERNITILSYFQKYILLPM